MFLGFMVLHIWSKFHVSSLIFEGEDLFWVILRKTHFCGKWAFLTIFGSNFQNLNISTHETYWNMQNLIESFWLCLLFSVWCHYVFFLLFLNMSCDLRNQFHWLISFFDLESYKFASFWPRISKMKLKNYQN